MAALYKAYFPIYLVLLTLGGFTSANRQLKETHHQQKTAALMNLQGSDSGNSNDSGDGDGVGLGSRLDSERGVGVGNTIGGVVAGISGGITIPGVFPGIEIPGISMGFPGVSIGVPGISVGIPGVSVHTPGISVGTPGVSVGGGGQAGVIYVPCTVYIPGYGCVSADPAQVRAISGGRLAYVSRAEMDRTHQVASKNSIGQETGKDHKMVVN